MKKINKLKSDYEKVCDEYIKAFVKKQGYEFDGWVAGKIGGVASFVEKYFFNFHDIVWDINSGQKKGLIFNWHEDYIENPQHSVSYYAYSFSNKK